MNEGGLRARNLQVLQKNRGHQLVHQDPAMLRIVLKLDDVELAVVGFEQVRLSASAHLADMAARREEHWK
jgi:hypothetical protein